MRRASSVISPITDASVSSFTEGTWARGITSMCTGACGPMSRKARHVSLSATSFAGISPPAFLQKRHDSAIGHLLLHSRDRRRERRERAPHDGERRDGGGLEAQGRVADRDGAEPRALERVQLVLLDAAFGSDGERDRAEAAGPVLAHGLERLRDQRRDGLAAEVEDEARPLGRRRDRALQRGARIDDREPRTARLLERARHPRGHLLAEHRAVAPRMHALRALPEHRPPARGAQLSRLLREPEHPVAVRDRQHRVHRRRRLRSRRALHGHGGVPLREAHEHAGAARAAPVEQPHLLPQLEPAYADVVRLVLAQGDRLPGRERIGGHEVDHAPSASRIFAQNPFERFSGGAAVTRASDSSSARSSAATSVGVHTCTRTCRSPVPLAFTRGNPRPPSWKTCPLCVPAGTCSVCGAVTPGTVTSAPSTACGKVTSTSVYRSSPSRSKRSSSSTSSITMMSPRAPPRAPALPTPRRCRYCPVETPAGTVMGIEWSPRCRPSPRHARQGDAMDTPSPRQVGHGATLANGPKNDRCDSRTSPCPPHVAHRVALVPGSAPVPSHRAHGSSNLALTVLVTPLATSASVSRMSILTSAPVGGPACVRPPPPNRSPKPKSRMKMLSASDRST